MNSIKTFVAISLAALSMNASAAPVNVQLKDTMVQCDHEELKILKNHEIDWEVQRSMIWNGTEYVPDATKTATIQFSLIDSKAFSFIMQLAKKDDAAAFKFIDSLDEQAFKLLCFYTQATKSTKISDGLKLKMLKDPKFQQIAEVKDDALVQNFMYSKMWIYKDVKSEHIATKYLNKNTNDPQFYKNNNDGLLRLLILIHFYQETMKQPLPINTDHLRKVFNAQSHDDKQMLLNKNLVIVS